jgi:hypothetical protein
LLSVVLFAPSLGFSPCACHADYIAITVPKIRSAVK